jgi:hypothetical protein
MAVALSKTNAPQPADPIKAILDAVDLLLKYMQSQFMIVNGKLDFLVDQVVQLRSDIVHLQAATDVIDERVRNISNQASAISLKLDDIHLSLMQELQTQRGVVCKRWADNEDKIPRKDITACLAEYVHWASLSDKPPFVRAPSASDPADQILREIYTADAAGFGPREANGRGLEALAEVVAILTKSTEPLTARVPNPFVLWSAADGYTTHNKPLLLKSRANVSIG